MVHCGDDSNSAEDQGLNAAEDRTLPPPISAEVNILSMFSKVLIVLNAMEFLS